ncbi:MAG: hypothetical protein AAFQ94_09905 [Bacteroidota bacterium]
MSNNTLGKIDEDSKKALKFKDWEETSIENVFLKPNVEDENFVAINDLTRQYFLLMMNVLESPFLGSFLTHNTRRDEVLVNGHKVKLKPEKRWKIETTPYTRSLLTDGAIIYNWSWKGKNDDKKRIEDADRLLRPFFERSVLKILLEDLHFQIVFINELIFSFLEDREKDEAKVHQLLRDEFNSEFAALIEKMNQVVGEFLNDTDYQTAYEYVLAESLNKLITETVIGNDNDNSSGLITQFLGQTIDDLFKSSDEVEVTSDDEEGSSGLSSSGKTRDEIDDNNNSRLKAQFFKLIEHLFEVLYQNKVEHNIDEVLLAVSSSEDTRAENIETENIETENIETEIIENLTKESVEKLEKQGVNVEFSVAFKALKTYFDKDDDLETFRNSLEEYFDSNVIPEDNALKAFRNSLKVYFGKGDVLDAFRTYLEANNELFYVVPHVPDNRKNIPMDFDIVVFIGKVLYGVSKEVCEFSTLLSNIDCDDLFKKEEPSELLNKEEPSELLNKEELSNYLEKKRLTKSEKDKLIAYLQGLKKRVPKDMDYKSFLQELKSWNFNLIAYRKMNGCSWMVPQDAVIKMDPNLLWPKVDITYEMGEKKESKKYVLKIENIANGIKWRVFEKENGALKVSNTDPLGFFFQKEGGTNPNKESYVSYDKLNKNIHIVTKEGEEISVSDFRGIDLQGDEVSLNAFRLKPSKNGGKPDSFMSQNVHEHGQTKATLNLNEFLNEKDENDQKLRIVTKKTVTFPYICGAFDLLTEIQFGESGDDKNNLLMFTT